MAAGKEQAAVHELLQEEDLGDPGRVSDGPRRLPQSSQLHVSHFKYTVFSRSGYYSFKRQ